VHLFEVRVYISFLDYPLLVWGPREVRLKREPNWLVTNVLLECDLSVVWTHGRGFLPCVRCSAKTGDFREPILSRYVESRDFIFERGSDCFCSFLNIKQRIGWYVNVARLSLDIGCQSFSLLFCDGVSRLPNFNFIIRNPQHPSYFEKYAFLKKMFHTKVIGFYVAHYKATLLWPRIALSRLCEGHLQLFKRNTLYAFTYSCSLSRKLSKTL